jgi:2-methylisocitrate lyase-like PEP mutase family enzyme
MSGCGDALRAYEIRQSGHAAAWLTAALSGFILGLIDRGIALCPSVLRKLAVEREDS